MPRLIQVKFNIGERIAGPDLIRVNISTAPMFQPFLANGDTEPDDDQIDERRGCAAPDLMRIKTALQDMNKLS